MTKIAKAYYQEVNSNPYFLLAMNKREIYALETNGDSGYR